MATGTKIEHYLDAMIEEGLYASRAGLVFHLEAVFGGVDIEDKRVLDIGGGAGYYCFYATCSGAGEVVCLEPEAKGSTAGANRRSQHLSSLLKCDNVTLEPVTFQAFSPAGRTFDVILLVAQ